MPGTWKQVPRYLMDPLGPLAIRWSYFPRVAPWLWLLSEALSIMLPTTPLVAP